MSCEKCIYECLKKASENFKIDKTFIDFMMKIHYACLRIYHIKLSEMAKSSKSGKPIGKMNLSQKEKAKIFSLVLFYFSNVKYQKINFIGPWLGLAEGFKCKNEDTAVQFFKDNLENKKFKDQMGCYVSMPPKSLGFMYKDKNGAHKIASENYQPYRGERLSLISNTISNATAIFKHRNCSDEYMYIHEFREIYQKQKDNIEYYFIVIAKGDRKNNLINFTTAFKLEGEDVFLKRLQKYEPLF